MGNTRAMTLTVLVTAVAVALSGCAGTPGVRWSDLDREPTASDALPDDLPPYAADGLDTETVRFAGEKDGVAVWLARPADERGVCMLAYGDAETWFSACGGEGGGGASGIGIGELLFQPDDLPVQDERMVPLSENVFIKAG